MQEARVERSTDSVQHDAKRKEKLVGRQLRSHTSTNNGKEQKPPINILKKKKSREKMKLVIHESLSDESLPDDEIRRRSRLSETLEKHLLEEIPQPDVVQPIETQTPLDKAPVPEFIKYYATQPQLSEEEIKPSVTDTEAAKTVDESSEEQKEEVPHTTQPELSEEEIKPSVTDTGAAKTVDESSEEQKEEVPHHQVSPMQKMLLLARQEFDIPEEKEKEEKLLQEEGERKKNPFGIVPQFSFTHKDSKGASEPKLAGIISTSPRKGSIEGVDGIMTHGKHPTASLMDSSHVQIRIETADRKLSSLLRKDSSDEKSSSGFEEPKTARITSKAMRFEYSSCPKTCERFQRVEQFAQTFIDALTQEALGTGHMLRQQSSIRIVEGIAFAEDTESQSTTSVDTYICRLEWPTIDEFTVEVGTAKIAEFLSYWKFQEDWKYCTNFLNGISDAASDFYRYEVIFSIPCKQYPIPQATASVYFTFEVSRIRPRQCLVELSYCFEGRRLIHTPGKFTFQEQILFQIVDAKIKFYKTLAF